MLGSLFSILPAALGAIGSLFNSNAGNNDIRDENTSVVETKSRRGLTSSDTTSKSNTLSSLLEALSSNSSGSQASSGSDSISRLDPKSLAALQGQFQAMLGDSATRSASNAQAFSALGQEQPFDKKGFVDGVVDSKFSQLRESLGASANDLAATAGATASGNSAVSLMQNQQLRQGEAQLAGVKSDAMATAEQLSQQGAMNVSARRDALNRAGNDNLSMLLGNLLNANQVSSTSGNVSTLDSQFQNRNSTNTQLGSQTGTNVQKVAETVGGLTDTTSNINLNKTTGSPFGNILKAISGLFSADF